MRVIKAHYDNGDTITTKINGSVSDIVGHYLDRIHIFDYGEREEKAICRCVEFIDELPRRAFGGLATLRRVYSISQAYKDRYDLQSKFRISFCVEINHGWEMRKHDCAYVSGMFDN